MRAEWGAYAEANSAERDTRRVAAAAAAAAGDAAGDDPRQCLPGGLYWLTLSLLVRVLAAAEVPAASWKLHHGQLSRLLQLLQPQVHASAHKVKKTTNSMRRQRLHALCGKWQASHLERHCARLLGSGGSGGGDGASGGDTHAPMQGALLFTLAWIHHALDSCHLRRRPPPPPTAPPPPPPPTAPSPLPAAEAESRRVTSRRSR